MPAKPSRSPLPLSGEEGPLAQEAQLPMVHDRDDNGKNEPMVSEVILPFAIQSRLVVPKTGVQEEVEAIIDRGCTHCLISLPTVLRLEIRTKPLTHPIRFEQVVGLLIAGPLPRSSLSLSGWRWVTLGTHPFHGGTKHGRNSDSRPGMAR